MSARAVAALLMRLRRLLRREPDTPDPYAKAVSGPPLRLKNLAMICDSNYAL
jgi:hypothetical protein